MLNALCVSHLISEQSYGLDILFHIPFANEEMCLNTFNLWWIEKPEYEEVMSEPRTEEAFIGMWLVISFIF